MHLSKNLKFLREQNQRQSQEALANALGITRSAVSSYEDGRAEPKLEVMNRIAEYFHISLDQLLNTDLTILPEIPQDTAPKEQKKITQNTQPARQLAVTVDKSNRENIEFISAKNANGYIANYANVDFLRDLPKYHLPFLSQGKTYRAFEISGESMPPLASGSIVVAEYVSDWQSITDEQACVVVSKRGIVLKKVVNQIAERGTLLLKSNNIAFTPYEVYVEDIMEIWRYVAYLSKEFPEPTNSIQDLREAFSRLEDEVREIRLKN